MRTLMVAAALCLAQTSIAMAQPAPAPAVTPPAASHYNSSTTEIGTLLDDPAAKAIIDKHIPGMSTNDQVDMARAMTLKNIQQYSPDQITDKVLADIDADLAKLPAKAPGK